MMLLIVAIFGLGELNDLTLKMNHLSVEKFVSDADEDVLVLDMLK